MIVRGRTDRITLDTREVEADPAEAYSVQQLVRERLRPDEQIVGFTLGYTSEVMRQVMRSNEHNHGPLLDSMMLPSQAPVRGLSQPKVEPEMDIAIDESGSISDYLASVEVVDSVWSGHRFDWAHNTADGWIRARFDAPERAPK